MKIDLSDKELATLCAALETQLYDNQRYGVADENVDDNREIEALINRLCEAKRRQRTTQ